MSGETNVNGKPSQPWVAGIPMTKRRKRTMRAIRIWTVGISSRWRKWVAQRENQERGKHEICLHCGAPISSSPNVVA
jgi:hypothetical protein